MNLNTLDRNNDEWHVNIDNYLNFNEQFYLDSNTKEWFIESRSLSKIVNFIMGWKYFWFKLYNNGHWLLLTPIYGWIKDNIVDKIDCVSYNVDFNLDDIDELWLNESIYFDFELRDNLCGENEEEFKTKLLKIVK